LHFFEIVNKRSNCYCNFVSSMFTTPEHHDTTSTVQKVAQAYLHTSDCLTDHFVNLMIQLII
jgi:hypothetical protein